MIHLLRLSEPMSPLLAVLVRYGCCLLASLPCLIAAVRGTRSWWTRDHSRVLIQQAGCVLAFLSLEHLQPVWPFRKTLWQRMILQGLWAVVCVLVSGSISRAGLALRIRARASAAATVATMACLLFVAVRSLLIQWTAIRPTTGGAVALEFIVYQMTVPGIAEELFYRGVLQPNLNRVFGRPWKVLGAQVGWGWVITSILFWAVHAFRVDAQMRLFLYWPTVTMQLLAGFVYGWVRERTESVFPPMLTHNLVNVVWSLV